MARLLHLDSSGRTDGSVSRRLSRYCVDTWCAAHPGDTVVRRDLAADVPPMIDDAWARAAFLPPDQRTEDDHAALRVSDTLVDEFLACDVHVVGIPMYNFNAPAPFKIYMDQVVRAGRTFVITEYGASGLVTGKRVFICGASISDYGERSPLAHRNHLWPWLRTVYGYMGVTDLSFFWVQSLPGEAGERGIAVAQSAIRQAIGA
jgi:FMN-dependent NADH-azoreductase